METNKFDDVIRLRRDDLILPWTVMTASLGVLAVVSSVMTQEKLPSELPIYYGLGFWALALGAIAASITLPQKYLRKAKIIGLMRAEPDLTQLATRVHTRAVDATLLADLTELTKNEQRLVSLTYAALKPLLLGLALSEVLALIGFGWSLVDTNFFAGFPMLVLAFALNAWHFPRVQALLARGSKEIKDEELADFDKDLREMEKDLNKRERPERPRRRSRSTTGEKKETGAK